MRINEEDRFDLTCGSQVRALKAASESGGTDNDPCAPGLAEESKSFMFHKDAVIEDMYLT